MNRLSFWKLLIPAISDLKFWKRSNSKTVAEMLGSPHPACPIRICGVTGYDGRTNDIVYCCPTIRAEKDTALIFFGGDIQDFPENMEKHRDHKNYVKWNLESTALLLHSRFPDSHIVVIRPSRMEFRTFSCFDNFVPCNNCGVPDHTPTHHSLQHLERLLQGISQRLRSMPECELSPVTSPEQKAAQEAGREDGEILPHDAEENEEDDEEAEVPDGDPGADGRKRLWWRENLNLDRAHLVLVGFSKGCVVLNQLIYEFHYLKTLTPDDETMMRLVSRIRDMYWLDGGHVGGKNTWITSRSLLETLTRLGIRIHIHVTPYQVQDDKRPWIRKEEKTFGDLLRRLGAPVERTLHFENQVASLHTHFELLTSFKTPGGN
ncbi:mitochondrial protein C2orf69 homolog isoform X2 [Bacillus rossius redtenbacheri]|uniref:mitochondrial protein C2orf69 homolog isoform X2 n=1 Tax=Bacillus rossius redtenbacheri TaxID=93214 RepID=UPI002FDD2CE6